MQKMLGESSWNLQLNKINFNPHHHDFEGEIIENRFTIVGLKYGMTYGKVSWIPIVKGKILKNDSSKITTVYVVIRFSNLVLGMLLSIGLFLFLILFVSIKHHSLSDLLFTGGFIFMINGFILFSYFKYSRLYMGFIKNILE